MIDPPPCKDCLLLGMCRKGPDYSSHSKAFYILVELECSLLDEYFKRTDSFYNGQDELQEVAKYLF